MSHPGSPFWVPSMALQRHVNRTMTGDPENDWLTHARGHLLAREIPRTLIVGCGDGFIERALVRMDGIGTILAVDADAAAVGRARRHAERRGMTRISHGVLDPEAEALPVGPWDLVIVHDALHHAARLEEAFAGIERVLSPRGQLVFVEYVGPDRFQYSDDRMEIVQRYLRMVPERLRKDPDTGRIHWSRERLDAAQLARARPFEAARSQDILPLARRVFAAQGEYPGGGGLIHPLLSGFSRNFGQAPAEEERLLQVLCDAETHLAGKGLLPSDFAVFVGRRRKAAAG
jgi:SAM-dependent methyltransferase